MAKMHIMDEDGIDGEIIITPTHRAKKFKRINDKGDVVESKRFLIFDAEHRDKILLDSTELEKRLINEDTEIDLEKIGRIVDRTTNIVVNDDCEAVFNFSMHDILTKDGETKERDHVYTYSNLNEEIPVKISKKTMSKIEAISKFIFRKSYYFRHTDGVSYKYLYDIAERIVKTGKMVVIQAFDQHTKKPSPLVLTNGGKQFNVALLEARIEGSKYSLILHLSDTQLKAPEPSTESVTKTTKETSTKKITKKSSEKKTSKKSTKKSTTPKTKEEEIMETALMIHTMTEAKLAESEIKKKKSTKKTAKKTTKTTTAKKKSTKKSTKKKSTQKKTTKKSTKK